MKQTLRDYLVFCDMDNTLLTAKEGIPSCNRTVIKLFTQLGGRFTVATGRPPESIRAALGDIQLALPAITLLYSLVMACNVMAGADAWRALLATLALGNIPTLVLLAIYAACREKRRKNSEMDKMDIHDL